MVFPAFPLLCPPSALNPYLMPQLLPWIMLRSNFASDLNISFCKSLSVSICLFIQVLLLPSFQSGLSWLWPPAPCRFSGHSSFGTSFLLDLSISRLFTNLPEKRKNTQCRAGSQFERRKKRNKTRILSTQEFTLQMLLQISVLTRPAIFPNPVSSFKSTRIYLFLLKLLLLFTHCFASSLIFTNFIHIYQF